LRRSTVDAATTSSSGQADRAMQMTLQGKVRPARCLRIFPEYRKWRSPILEK
jgi:hypothetical protein